MTEDEQEAFTEELIKAMRTPLDPDTPHTNKCCWVVHADYPEDNE